MMNIRYRAEWNIKPPSNRPVQRVDLFLLSEEGEADRNKANHVTWTREWGCGWECQPHYHQSPLIRILIFLPVDSDCSLGWLALHILLYCVHWRGAGLIWASPVLVVFLVLLHLWVIALSTYCTVGQDTWDAINIFLLLGFSCPHTYECQLKCTLHCSTAHWKCLMLSWDIHTDDIYFQLLTELFSFL